MRTGLYLQLEETGHQIIARIRTKETVYSWGAFWTRSDAENWARREYTQIQLGIDKVNPSQPATV